MSLLIQAFRHADMADSIGMRVVETSGGMVIGDGPCLMLGGGFYMHREQAAELHRQIGAWLAATGATP